MPRGGGKVRDMTELVIRIDIEWIEKAMGKEKVDQLLNMLVSSNDNSKTAICIETNYEESCRPGSDIIILDLLHSLIE